jgi:hypothetical protein
MQNISELIHLSLLGLLFPSDVITLKLRLCKSRFGDLATSACSSNRPV